MLDDWKFIKYDAGYNAMEFGWSWHRAMADSIIRYIVNEVEYRVVRPAICKLVGHDLVRIDESFYIGVRCRRCEKREGRWL